jgi:hypothetical protein
MTSQADGMPFAEFRNVNLCKVTTNHIEKGKNSGMFIWIDVWCSCSVVIPFLFISV